MLTSWIDIQPVFKVTFLCRSGTEIFVKLSLFEIEYMWTAEMNYKYGGPHANY